MTLPLAEKKFQGAVIDAARLMGYRVAHFRTVQTRDGRWMTPVQADGAGFPDLCCVRERTVWVELKKQGGRLDPAQKVWLRDLLGAGAEAYVARPADWDDLAAVLRARHPRWNAVAGGAPVWALEAYERLTARTRAEVEL